MNLTTISNLTTTLPYINGKQPSIVGQGLCYLGFLMGFLSILFFPVAIIRKKMDPIHNPESPFCCQREKLTELFYPYTKYEIKKSLALMETYRNNNDEELLKICEIQLERKSKQLGDDDKNYKYKCIPTLKYYPQYIVFYGVLLFFGSLFVIGLGYMIRYFDGDCNFNINAVCASYYDEQYHYRHGKNCSSDCDTYSLIGLEFLIFGACFVFACLLGGTVFMAHFVLSNPKNVNYHGNYLMCPRIIQFPLRLLFLLFIFLFLFILTILAGPFMMIMLSIFYFFYYSCCAWCKLDNTDDDNKLLTQHMMSNNIDKDGVSSSGTNVNLVNNGEHNDNENNSNNDNNKDNNNDVVNSYISEQNALNVEENKVDNNDEDEIKELKPNYWSLVTFYFTAPLKMSKKAFRYIKLWPNDDDLSLKWTMGKTYNQYIEKKRKIDEILQSRGNNNNNNDENEGTTVQI